jgi:hypothetical protein
MSALVTQPTSAPTRKVAAGAIGATGLGLPLAQIIVFAFGYFGVALSPDLAAAIGTVVTALVGYAAAWLTSERAPAA